jgi:hypothetical protein
MREGENLPQSNPGASSLCANNLPGGIAWGCEPVYDASVARHAHPCAAARRANPSRGGGAKPRGLPPIGGSRVAEQGGGAARSSAHIGEGGACMRPSSSEAFHAGLALHSSTSLLGGRPCGRCGR